MDLDIVQVNAEAPFHDGPCVVGERVAASPRQGPHGAIAGGLLEGEQGGLFAVEVLGGRLGRGGAWGARALTNGTMLTAAHGSTCS
jgi:hypothetical protein